MSWPTRNRLPFDIVADENIDPKIRKALVAAGHQVVSIWEDHRGSSDLEILQFALTKGKLVLTEDKDFGEYIFSHKIPTAGVIFLRYEYSDLGEFHPRT